MVSDFIFHLRDDEAYLRDVKTTNRLLKSGAKQCVCLIQIITLARTSFLAFKSLAVISNVTLKKLLRTLLLNCHFSSSVFDVFEIFIMA